MTIRRRHRSTERRQQKITLGEMRGSGVRGLLIYCSDFRCSHWTAISADRWPDHVRLSGPHCTGGGAEALPGEAAPLPVEGAAKQLMLPMALEPYCT